MKRNQDITVRQHRDGSWHVYDEAEGHALSEHDTEDAAYAARWDGLTDEQQEDEEAFFA